MSMKMVNFCDTCKQTVASINTDDAANINGDV